MFLSDGGLINQQSAASIRSWIEKAIFGLFRRKMDETIPTNSGDRPMATGSECAASMRIFQFGCRSRIVRLSTNSPQWGHRLPTPQLREIVNLRSLKAAQAIRPFFCCPFQPIPLVRPYRFHRQFATECRGNSFFPFRINDIRKKFSTARRTEREWLKISGCVLVCGEVVVAW